VGRVMDARPILFAFMAGAVLGAGMYGCSQARADGSTSARHEVGIASVYSSRESGGRTASGRHLDDRALTAAHKSLPLGAQARVTNRANGRSIVVTITDRGPFVRGRIIDLTPAGASALGFGGLTPVTVERVQ